MLEAIITGIALGLSLVMPIGPLNIFIFNNSSLQRSFKDILPVVLMAAVCDMALILSAVWGADIVSSIQWFKPILSGMGIIFLTYMGVTMWRSATAITATAGVAPKLGTQLLYSASLSIFNPHAILDTFVVIGGISTTFIPSEKIAFVSGCIFIDFAWFTFLGVFGYFIKRFSKGPVVFYYINKLSAVLMLILAAKLIIEFFD